MWQDKGEKHRRLDRILNNEGEQIVHSRVEVRENSQNQKIFAVNVELSGEL